MISNQNYFRPKPDLNWSSRLGRVNCNISDNDPDDPDDPDDPEYLLRGGWVFIEFLEDDVPLALYAQSSANVGHMMGTYEYSEITKSIYSESECIENFEGKVIKSIQAILIPNAEFFVGDIKEEGVLSLLFSLSGGEFMQLVAAWVWQKEVSLGGDDILIFDKMRYTLEDFKKVYPDAYQVESSV